MVDDRAGFEQVCADLARALAPVCRDRWVLIGSAAARLLGAEVDAADLDVLTSCADAQALMDAWAARRLPGGADPTGDARFRSHFARFGGFGVPVEVMGDLAVYGDTGWEPVEVTDLRVLPLHGAAVTIPTRAAQIQLLELFGRPKDCARAALLRSLPESTAP